MRSQLVLLLLPGVALAQTAKVNPFGSDAQAVEIGRISFRMNCAPCHGIRAEGGRAPDLTRSSYAAGEELEMFNLLNEGVAGTEMGSFSSLGDENIWRLVSYLRSLSRKDEVASSGDRVAGEKLFWGKGGCGQCHRAGDRGGQLGPDLTLAGRQRSLAYLRESILSPDADLSPGYNTITVMTRDGKKIVGVQRGFDNFSAQLVDMNHNFYSFLKSDVVSIQREFRSLMPGGYRDVFTDTELNDLLAYLTGLRGAEAKR